MTLDKYHLTKDKKNDNWRLEKAGSDRAIAKFENKAAALKGGVLKKAIGDNGGSVRIHKQSGQIQQERTYPRSKDPKASKG